jgi:Leucyl aminopeptidase
MKQIKNIDEIKDNMIYPIYKDKTIHNSVIEHLGYDVNGIVSRKESEVTVIRTLGKYDFEKIIFVGLGLSKECTTLKLRDAIRKATKHVNVKSVVYLDGVVSEQLDATTITKVTVESYITTAYKQVKVGCKEKEIIDIDICVSDRDIEGAIRLGRIYGEGINYARRLADAPPNIMTPAQLVIEAKALAKQYNMECTILDKEELTKMEAGGILAVNQGSHIPAYMIVLKYSNGSSVYSGVVGKGLTFDSGGYSLKGNSYGMKYDMCGGADVLGIMRIIAESQMKVNVYGVIPTTENLVSGEAYKPEDVITTLSKKTIEVVSTDAEGRLILCDALTHVQNLGAKRIVDLATLTGACVAALGDVYTGVFSNSDKYYQEFEKAMQQSDEMGWRLPIHKQYLNKLKSQSADLKNSVGKVGAGASVAANFLECFINEGVEWIHLDIAGTSDNEHKGATGTMIRSVVQLLKNTGDLND